MAHRIVKVEAALPPNCGHMLFLFSKQRPWVSSKSVIMISCFRCRCLVHFPSRLLLLLTTTSSVACSRLTSTYPVIPLTPSGMILTLNLYQRHSAPLIIPPRRPFTLLLFKHLQPLPRLHLCRLSRRPRLQLPSNPLQINRDVNPTLQKE
jgi:hypothetical protein